MYDIGHGDGVGKRLLKYGPGSPTMPLSSLTYNRYLFMFVPPWSLEIHTPPINKRRRLRLISIKGLSLEFLHKFQDGVEDSAGWSSCFIPEHQQYPMTPTPPLLEG